MMCILLRSGKDVFFHLWIPALGLVPEVNAGFWSNSFYMLMDGK